MPKPDPVVARRRAHALLELSQRGILKSRRYPPGLRLLMWLMPQLKAPYYGDYGIYGTLMGVMFGLPFVVILTVVFRLGDDIPGWLGPACGAFGGAAFGVMMTGFMKSVQRRTQLTAWDDLDEPPGEAPDGAEDYRDVESDFMRRPSGLGRGRRR